MNLSKRMTNMAQSGTRVLVKYADKAEKKGVEVIKLNIGQPDIETPKEFGDAIKNYIDNNKVIAYTGSRGIDPLRKAIVDYFKRDNINFDLDEVYITNGGSEAISLALTALCDPGDEILTPEPYYTNYKSFTDMTGVIVKPLPTIAKTGFHLDTKEALLKCITPKTKAILFSNPGNPTGVVFTKEELTILNEIAKEKGIWLISDEVYRRFEYDGLEATSMLQIPGAEEHTIIVDSVSKRYSACGCRIGCICSKNKKFNDEFLKLAQSRLSAPILEQVGAAALYNLPDSYIADAKVQYNKRRDIVFETLKSIEGVEVSKPTGAFYVVVTLPVKNALEFSKWMLEEFSYDNKTVMVAPGSAFYMTNGEGENQIRIAYVKNTETIKTAMNVLKEGLIAYSKR